MKLYEFSGKNCQVKMLLYLIKTYLIRGDWSQKFNKVPKINIITIFGE